MKSHLRGHHSGHRPRLVLHGFSILYVCRALPPWLWWALRRVHLGVIDKLEGKAKRNPNSVTSPGTAAGLRHSPLPLSVLIFSPLSYHLCSVGDFGHPQGSDSLGPILSSGLMLYLFIHSHSHTRESQESPKRPSGLTTYFSLPPLLPQSYFFISVCYPY